jgi:predicted nucleotidyltransferase
MSAPTTLTRHGITLPADRIAEFCRRWKMRELAVFGSFLRDDFDAESDLDFLYVFDRDARWGLEDLVTMEEELALIVGRGVDLVSRRAVERSPNFIRRRHILGSAELIYVG